MYLAISILYTVTYCMLSTLLLSRWYLRKNDSFVIEKNKVQPKTCVVVTHYGWSEAIERNLNTVLSEAKAIDAQVIAVTQYIDGAPDKSYASLKKYAVSCDYLNVLISDNVCDLNVRRAQKCQNQRVALQQMSPDCEIIIFVDNDASLPERTLELMSKKLMYSNAISATGSRFYIPKIKSPAALIVSAWINVGHLLQKATNVDLHWGGLFAIKNRPIIVNGFFDALENSISDDCSLSILVKALNGSSILVDEAIATSIIDHFSLKELYEFTNRQTILGVKSRALRLIVPGFILLAALPLLSLWMLFYSFVAGLTMWGMITVIFTIASFSFPKTLLNRTSFMDFLWLLFLPFCFVLMGYNALYSLFVSHICWSGIKYKFNKNGSCQSAEKSGILQNQ